MWYFAWILGLGFALAMGIISLLWLETHFAFGKRDETTLRERFEAYRKR
ncbi:cytochrome bd-I oxidase subunit CydX [Paludibacterium paludis]|nr:cytochrome bd-I oxidase subunit CydX [Paludibacterium paludis]